MNRLADTITQALCEQIVARRGSVLDPHLMDIARRLFVDGIAVAVAGSQLEEAPRLLAEHFADPLIGAGGTAASLIGLDATLGVVAAALVNGASMHVLDFEPIWVPATHALSPALAAALALGEALSASGEKILHAMVLGIEVQGLLRVAGSGVAAHNLRFHPPGFVGPIGAAVAAGFLLDFDAGQLATAIGIVGSRCGGLFANLGTMTKATHCGYAAAFGVDAALLTRRGFTGSQALLDPSSQSYGNAFYGYELAPEAFATFGRPFRIEEPGFAIKLFPAKFSTHYAITAALALRERIVSPDDIVRVGITAADIPSSDRPHPRSGLDGKFSLQYTTAIALLDGDVTFGSFTDEHLHRDDVQALLRKITVRRSRDISSVYTQGRYLDLEIELGSGEVLRERCERPRGAWGSAPITHEELQQKAFNCLTVSMTTETANACLALCNRFERLDGDGVQSLARLLSTGRPSASGNSSWESGR